jgi:hypothetical protein
VSCKGRLVGARQSYSFSGIYSSLGAEFIELWGEITIGGRVLGGTSKCSCCSYVSLEARYDLCEERACTIRARTPKYAKGSNYLC